MNGNSTTTALLIGIGLIIGVCGNPFAAKAAWPSGGQSRTLPGPACTPFTFRIDTSDSECPFVSDYIAGGDSYYADNNSVVYVDFHVSSIGGGGYTLAEACRQSYTGAAVVCAADTSESDGTTGVKELAIGGFGTISTAPNVSDYFFVHISTTEVVDQIYGLDYGG